MYVEIRVFTTQSRLLMTLKMSAFEIIVGKGENAGNQHFLLFPQCFLPIPKSSSGFEGKFILLSASAFNLVQSEKILMFDKQLITGMQKALEHYINLTDIMN